MISNRFHARLWLPRLLALILTVLTVGQAVDGRSAVRVMPLGDSITWDSRVGDTRPDGLRIAYRQYLWFLLQDGGFDVDFVGSIVAGQDALPPFDPDNEGHGGWTAGQIAANIYNWLVLHPADVVLLHIGTNGLTTDPSAVQSILNEIDRFETDYSTDVTVFLARIVNRVPYSAATTQFNDNVAAMAQARIDSQHDKIVLVDIEDGAGIDYRVDTSGINGDMYDYLHPNFKGYQKMAATWYAALRPFLQGKGCPEGITHYWKLDETSGPTYGDSYGFDSASCSSCPTAVTGRIDGAQQFDNASQVEIAGDSTFDWGPTASFSVECWLNANAGSGVRVLLGRNGGVGLGTWWLGLDATGRGRFHLSDISGTADALTTSVIGQNEWHHLAATRDGTSGAICIYLDGVRQDSLTGLFAQGFASAGTVTMGWFDSSPFYHFDGSIDEAATYDSVLSPTQILGHYNNGLAALGYCDGEAFGPVITSQPMTSVMKNQPFAYDAQATGNPKPTFRLLAAPNGMTVDSASGLVQWTPISAGYFSVVLIASNAVASDTQSFGLTVHTPPACPPGMVHYWMLDESSGPTYADSYDNTPATCSTCPASAPGQVDGCQYFNGSAHLNINDDGTFDWSPTDNFTIEFWMKKATTCSQNEVILGRIESGMNWWIGIDCPSGRIRFRLQNSTGLIDLYSAGSVEDGFWHHVLVTRDGSLQQTRLYLDGVLNDESAVAYATGFAASAPMTIGYFSTGGYFGYIGFVDDIALYNRAFAPSDVQTDYNEGAGGSGHCLVWGDADNSGGVDISDAVFLVGYIFGGGPAPNPLYVGDANCSDGIDISDVIYVISYIFAGGPEPCGSAK